VLTGDERYLENAKSGYRTLEQLNLLLHGQVFDGVRNKSVFQTKWTYNAGMALGALTALYQSTHDDKFLALGEEVTKSSFEYFWQNGHLRESGMMEELLYPDQYSFKGLFLHYLARFLAVARHASRLDIEWVGKLKSKCDRRRVQVARDSSTARRQFLCLLGRTDCRPLLERKNQVNFLSHSWAEYSSTIVYM
jgi:hypothetical protein